MMQLAAVVVAPQSAAPFRASEYSLAEAWRDPQAREMLLTFLRKGILADFPDQAETLVARLQLDVANGARDADALRDIRAHFAVTGQSGLRDEAYRIDENRRVARRVTQLVEMFPVDYSPKSFLDIGCGDGRITAGLAKTWNLSGTDAFGSDVYNRVGEQAGFTYLNMQDGCIPLPDQAVEVAFLLMTLHHEQDAAKLIDEAERVLKPNGLLIVRDHDARAESDRRFLNAVDNIYYGLFSKLSGIPVPANYKSIDTWSTAICAAGFSAIASEHPEPASPMKPFHAVFRKITPFA